MLRSFNDCLEFFGVQLTYTDFVVSPCMADLLVAFRYCLRFVRVIVSFVLISIFNFYFILQAVADSYVPNAWIWWNHNLSVSLNEVWSWHVSKLLVVCCYLCIIVILFIFFDYIFWHQTRTSLELNFNVRIVMRLLFYIG